MPLSSVLGAQSLVRPGVCTSSTRPASPFEGQLIYETDTNRVVAYDGSNWVYAVDTDQPPGLQLVKTQTIGSAVSSVAVSDVFSADFDNYYMTVSGGVASTSTQIHMTLGSASSGYRFSVIYMAANSNTVGGSSSNSTTRWDAVVGGTTNTLSGECWIQNPNVAKNTTAFWRSHRAESNGESIWGNGALSDTTQYTAFTLTCNTGTLTGGTIRVYGYRNS